MCNEARSWNHPLHQIWPREWNIISKQLNWQVLILMLKLPSTDGRERQVTEVCCSICWHHPHPRLHTERKNLKPHIQEWSLMPSRVVEEWANWVSGPLRKKQPSSVTAEQQSYFRIWWRQKGVLRVPSSKHSGGLNPFNAFYPWLSRIGLVLGPQRVERSAPTKDSRPQPVFALHLVLRISGDKKVERNNIQTSV